MSTPLQTLESFSVLRASVTGSDPHEAVAELRAEIHQDDACLGIVFFDAGYDRPLLLEALASAFGDVPYPVIGCTTAGEVTQHGFQNGLTGCTIAGSEVRAFTRLIPDLDAFDVTAATQLAESLEREQEEGDWEHDPNQCFAFLLVDGLSMREEALSYTLQGALGDIPLFGGSAGDGLDFNQTLIYFDGEFHKNAASVTIIQTTRPFKLFKTQHFEASEEKLVITSADVERRIVREINAEPAAKEYARLLGVAPDELTPRVFARNPIMLRMGGNWYVRSIQKVNEDGTLTIYCAIDEGLVLTLGKGLSFVESLRETLDEVRQCLGGAPLLTIGCDCILRRLEVEEFDLSEAVRPIFDEFRILGFSTYGEQFGSVHVNQTLTGVAIG